MSVGLFQKRTVLALKTNQKGGIGEIMATRDNASPWIGLPSALMMVSSLAQPAVW